MQKQPATYRIYTMSDPLSGSIFYVGRTKSKLYKRLSLHMTSKPPSRELRHYITEMKDNGRKPKIEEIDSCDNNEESKRQEEYWINQLYSWGYDLFNIQLLRRGYNKRKDSWKWVRIDDDEFAVFKSMYRHGDYGLIAKRINKSIYYVSDMIPTSRWSVLLRNAMIDHYEEELEKLTNGINYLKILTNGFSKG